MKKLLLTLVLFATGNLCLGAEAGVGIVSKPLSATVGEGEFHVTPQTGIAVGREAGLRRSAELFAQWAAPTLGGELKCGDKGAISLGIDSSLDVATTGISLRGGSAQGVFYGLQSLRQLIVAGRGTK